MGGSHRRDERKKETKEERLLRKAKEYVKGSDRKEERKRHHKEDRKERKRRRNDDSEESHHRKKKKHHERKDRKKKKHYKLDSKKKESSRKRPNKKNLIPLGEPLGHAPETLLDAEKDYFAYHQHLWLYLYREEGAAFNDLTSDESREAFERFVEKYNAGDLELAYYDPKGVPSAALEESQTTRHSWSFRTSEAEEKSLHALQEGVRKQTEYDAAEGTSKPQSYTPSSAARQPQVDERPRRTAEDRYTDRVGNRRLKEHVLTVEEEMTGGRKEGRERQIEKRKELSRKIHGAGQDREAAPELSDDRLYGNEQASFQAALAREKQRTAQRQEKKNARITELQKKENEKQEAMLKMLGLSNIQPGQKIQIAPRKDG